MADLEFISGASRVIDAAVVAVLVVLGLCGAATAFSETTSKFAPLESCCRRISCLLALSHSLVSTALPAPPCVRVQMQRALAPRGHLLNPCWPRVEVCGVLLRTSCMRIRSADQVLIICHFLGIVSFTRWTAASSLSNDCFAQCAFPNVRLEAGRLGEN